MSNLRNKLIRLAHANPSLREDLLPLIKESSIQIEKVTLVWDISTHEGSVIDEGENTFPMTSEYLDYAWKSMGRKTQKQKIVSKSIDKNWIEITTDLYDISIRWKTWIHGSNQPFDGEQMMKQWLSKLKEL